MRKDRLKEMAQFVVHLQMTPEQYFALTWEQRDAILTEWARANRKR